MLPQIIYYLLKKLHIIDYKKSIINHLLPLGSTLTKLSRNHLCSTLMTTTSLRPTTKTVIATMKGSLHGIVKSVVHGTMKHIDWRGNVQFYFDWGGFRGKSLAWANDALPQTFDSLLSPITWTKSLSSMQIHFLVQWILVDPFIQTQGKCYAKNFFFHSYMSCHSS